VKLRHRVMRRLLTASTGLSYTGPIMISAQAGSDASQFAVDISHTKGASTQAFILRDAYNSPIFSCGPTGGPVAWGDRLGASPNIFQDKLAFDGGISVPALVYLKGNDLGNYANAPHHWVCMVGQPGTVLANLKNNNGNYVACQVGDRYSRVDSAECEYRCTVAGVPAAGETGGTWEPIVSVNV